MSQSPRDRIVDAAIPVFAATGFYGTTIRAVGGPIGVANASLLHHFGNKRRLYGAVLERVAQSLGVLGTPSGPADLVDGIFAWHVDNPHLARIVLRELADNAERVGSVDRWYLAPAMTGLADCIAAWQRDGIVRAGDPMLQLLHVIGSVAWFTTALPTVAGITDREPASLLDAFQREHRTLVLRALT